MLLKSYIEVSVRTSIRSKKHLDTVSYITFHCYDYDLI